MIRHGRDVQTWLSSASPMRLKGVMTSCPSDVREIICARPSSGSDARAIKIKVTATVSMTLPAFRDVLERASLIGFLEPVDGLAPPVETRVLEGEWPIPSAIRWLRLTTARAVQRRG